MRILTQLEYETRLANEDARERARIRARHFRRVTFWGLVKLLFGLGLVVAAMWPLIAR